MPTIVDQTVCRICGGEFFTHRLVYENMPGAAQNFPDSKNLAEDIGQTLTIRQCRDCGVVQSVSPPVAYYRDVIRATAFSDEMAGFRQQQFARLDEQYGFSRGKLLEVGAGRGEYLELMTQSGWQVVGLEHDPAAVEAVRAKKLQIIRGFLENTEQKLEGAPFDGFVIFNFLEHIPDLKTFFSALLGNLKPGALGLIEVPNFELMIRESMATEFIADHIYYFTESSLRHTLESFGLEVVSSEIIWHDYILSAVVKKREPVSFNNFTEREAKLRQDVHDYLDRYPGQHLAVWGAGHQALASIVLADIQERISYVIDSAPFKQNKYTPASHLPIVAPGHLDEEPVDIILIIAAAYSDEVAAFIKETYDDRFHVAILREAEVEILN